MRGKGWRQYLFASLLAASLADVSCDLNDDSSNDPSTDSRSGYLNDDFNSNESKAENGDGETILSNFGTSKDPTNDDKRQQIFPKPLVVFVDPMIDKNDPIYNMENQNGAFFSGPSVYPPGYRFPIIQDVNDAELTHDHLDHAHSDHAHADHDQSKSNLYHDHSGHDHSNHGQSNSDHSNHGYLVDNLNAGPSWTDKLKHDPIYIMENSGDDPWIPKPSASSPQHKYPRRYINAAEPYQGHVQGPLVKDKFIIPEGQVVQDELVIPKDPTYETFAMKNEYPYNSGNLQGLGSTLLKRHNFFSKLIPVEKHIALHKIPGAENIIQCNEEGEIHNFWAPGFQCMVCVCLAARGRLRPVCVSCQSCLEPVTESPYTPPPLPPTTPPSPPEQVSCKPLPVNVPFASPLDPCKVCTCTETIDPWGKIDVNIQCKDNSQCVLPSTPHTDVTTQIPLVVCDKFPPYVWFPHPHDACKTCQCSAHRSPRGQLERQIVCRTSPDCVSTERPWTTTPAPSTPPPQPENARCAPLPTGKAFQSPINPCQICTCSETADLFGRVSVQIDCQDNLQCILPHNATTLPPEIVTGVPLPACKHFPENVLFPHPSEECKVCRCYIQKNAHGVPTQHINCYTRPECLPTPSPSTTPQSEPATCAPLPTNKPFQHPLNPCQMCVCSEGRDVYGEIEVLIECQENPQCVVPPDFTSVSPDIQNRTIVPACKNFPVNVYFPHPADACKVCKCNLVQKEAYSPPEPVMSCSIKPECLPPPPPSTTDRPPNPDPLHLCKNYLDNVVFPDPLDECRLCKCYRDLRHGFKRVIICYLKPECSSTSRPLTTTPEPEPEIVSCAPLPTGVSFQSPANPCQVCLCTERVDLFGRHDVHIECKDNSQCVLQPEVHTVPPVIVKPIRWPACKNFPQHLTFPHPRDPCQRCKCTVQNDLYGEPVEHIDCSFVPECVPVTTEQPDNDICRRYPVDAPFDDPNDRCRTCTCIQIGSAPTSGLQSSLFLPKYQILCQIKPECLVPTTEKPDNEICGRYPVDTPFDDPNDRCQTCTCIQIGSAPTSGLQSSLFLPKYQIMCQIKPECLPVTTEQPDNEICRRYPVDTQFDDPNDRCRTCTCIQIGSAPTSNLQSSLFLPKYQIMCQIKPECLPVTTEQPNNEICGRYPVDTPFDDPNDRCQTCTCIQIGSSPTSGLQSSLFLPKYQILCQIKPECLPVTTEQPDNEICGRYPVDTPFDDPNDRCRTCTCIQIGSAPTSGLQSSLFLPKYQILCQIKPECLPVTTEQPDNDICRRYPVDAQFDDPNDRCRTCTCIQIGSAPTSGLQSSLFLPKYQILCQVKPECLPPSTEQPDNDICGRYPVDTPFDDPNDRCRTCTCIQIGSAPTSGLQSSLFLPKYQILCQIKPECLPVTTEQPDNEICGRYPVDTPFDDPNDRCRTCTCIQIGSAPTSGLQSSLFLPKYQILCQVKPECLPPSTEQPDNEICGRYPVDTPFDDPNDRCRTCTCIQIGSAPTSGLQSSLFLPKYQILCQVKPECLPIPPPTTEIVPYDVCGKYPLNTPFEDPYDHCRTCVCSYKQPGSAEAPGSQLTLFPPQLQILCHIKPECDEPQPNSLCDYHEVDVPFDDPRDSCRSCVCYWSSPGAAAPAQGLMHALRIKLYKCALKPECLPTPLPITEEPEEYDFCKNYPVEMPFTDPRDPCHSCVCYYSSDAGAGAPAGPLARRAPVKLYKCALKPECYLPTAEPITKSPPLEVSCKPLPSGVPFQSPLNPCQICTCSETIDMFGKPDVLFKCQTNPQCVIPIDVTTVPPDSHTSPVPLPACSQFPTNVVFPHPSEPCKLCKCTVTSAPWGQPDQLISCFPNPECAISSTTVAPWPPAPPGPLPGPAPHESCSPYIPNQPFQHPWDECQVCVCREAISSERITIEVNCYTKPSCCIEPPVDISGPGLPGGIKIESRPLIDGSSSNWVNPGSGSNNQNVNWKYSENENDYSGGSLIGSTGGNVIYTSGGNLIGPPSGPLYIQGETQTYDQSVIDLNSGSSVDVGGENWIGAQDNSQISVNENTIRQYESLYGSAGGNSIRPTGPIRYSSGNVIDPAGQSWTKSTHSFAIDPTSAHVYGPTGGNVMGPTSGNVIGTGGNLYEPMKGNSYGSSGGYLIGSNHQTSLNSKGNLYVPNRGNLLFKSKDVPGPGPWRPDRQYNLRLQKPFKVGPDEGAYFDVGQSNNGPAYAVGQQRYSNKMRTKSGRPSDNDSEDYD